jgi:carbon-monoxide dehydrogenase small subunit
MVPKVRNPPNGRVFGLGERQTAASRPQKQCFGKSEEAHMAAVSLTVNGKPVSTDVDPRTLLVQLLRENLRLTGTHVGCDTSQCGACVVHVNGKAIKSCTVLALQLEGADVLTIEGLAPADGPLHPMQEAFRENHGLQCGYCTPGMILTAVDMVRRKGHELDDHTIREELEGNLCRCTGYHNIVKAIAAGARAMKNTATAKAAE